MNQATTPPAVDDDTEVLLTMTLGQARALAEAAEAFSRIAIGQLNYVAEMVRFEVVPCRQDAGLPRRPASAAVCEQIDLLMQNAKALLGYPPGASLGIGNPHVHIDAHRAWEVRKVLVRALAMHRDPEPTSRGVDYDGLIVRYTSDKAPTVDVRKAHHSD